MKVTLFSLLIFFFTLNEAFLQQIFIKPKLDLLKEKIIKEIDNTQGIFAVAFCEVDNEENEIIINGNEIFHAASTMKTPVMVEVFRQASLGKFSLDDSLLVKNEFHSIVDGSTYSLDINDDSDDKIYSQIGTKRKIYDLVYDMITVSSNLATNLLIELVDAQNVTETMKNYGLENIKVLRGVEDIKAFQLGMNNTVNASDLMQLYKLIASLKILNEKSCDQMINILLDQKIKDKIPRFLPDNVKVAHKTGSITAVEHDSGIIFLPNGRKYILVILSKNLESSAEGKEVIGRISKLIYDYMIN